MFFADRLQLGTPKRTKEGYLAVRAKAARAGIYDYLGRELDPEGKHFRADETVKVYRPPEEVFSTDSVRSFLLKPITDDHPSQPVTADNWRSYAKGVNAAAMRDGDHLAFDLVLMDRGAITSVEGGKRELSNGYSSEIEIGDGVTPDGKPYHAIQRNIRGNHIALVKAGRAGPECRIGDCSPCLTIDEDQLSAFVADGQTYRSDKLRDNFQPIDDKPSGRSRKMKTITIDSVPFEVDDQAAAAVEKIQGQLTAANDRAAKAETDVATLTTQLATKDAELVTAKAQLADASSPQRLRDAAKSYQAVVDKAKALGVTVTDAMSEADIVKAAVTAKVGDAAKDWNADQFNAAFATLQGVASRDAGVDPVRQILSDGAAGPAVSTKQIRDGARASRYSK